MITVGVLTHNERESIRLLEQLSTSKRPVSVFVLDDFSDPEFFDQLSSECRRHNYPVHQHKLRHDFGAQRNHLLSLMPKSGWICMLDADEEVRSTFFGFCHDAITSAPDADSFFVTRRNIRKMDDGSHDVGLEKHIRLFRNIPSVQWKGRVHEQLVGMKKTGSVSECAEILHSKTMQRCHAQHLFYDEHFYQKGIRH